MGEQDQVLPLSCGSHIKDVTQSFKMMLADGFKILINSNKRPVKKKRAHSVGVKCFHC